MRKLYAVIQKSLFDYELTYKFDNRKSHVKDPYTIKTKR